MSTTIVYAAFPWNPYIDSLERAEVGETRVIAYQKWECVSVHKFKRRLLGWFRPRYVSVWGRIPQSDPRHHITSEDLLGPNRMEIKNLSAKPNKY